MPSKRVKLLDWHNNSDCIPDSQMLFICFMVKPKISAEMEESALKKASTMYIIDLTKIEGDGDFPCPCCGVVISPEDETENAYAIQEVKMQEDEQLEKLVIRCNGCRSVIHIIGFTP